MKCVNFDLNEDDDKAFLNAPEWPCDLLVTLAKQYVSGCIA